MMWVCHGLSPNGAWPPISDHFHAEHDEIPLLLFLVFWVPNSWDVWIWGWIKTHDFPCECEDEHQQQPAVLVNGAGVLTHADMQHVTYITTAFLCRGYVYLDWTGSRFVIPLDSCAWPRFELPCCRKQVLMFGFTDIARAEGELLSMGARSATFLLGSVSKNMFLKLEVVHIIKVCFMGKTT